MQRNLRIYYTSDMHGFFSPLDYATGKSSPTGLANCMAQFVQDGNTLVIDGGDTLQGSPLTYFLSHAYQGEDCIPAGLLNLAGYDFVTLGNHDFNYGRQELERYLAALEARCLCANIEGVDGVGKTAVVRMKNGLRVGLTGVTTHYVEKWEKPENMTGIRVSDAFTAAEAALAELRAQHVDLCICIYHGGFERDVHKGTVLSESDENQGWRICQELDFDVLLTGHQHLPMAQARVHNTYVCQPPDKASAFVQMEIREDRSVVGEEYGNAVASGRIRVESSLCPAGAESSAAALAMLAPVEEENARWLDTPVGSLDSALCPASHLEMASEGSLIANFFNQVQREASGAELSVTSLANTVKGFSSRVTIRDVVSTYVFPNTLVTLSVDRRQLKTAMERSAAYFTETADGELAISEDFLKPVVQHFNYDYLSGIQVVYDLSRPVGDRVVSLLYQGEELSEDHTLSLCMNNYRASGAGGYEVYRECPVLREDPTEISELIIDYVLRHRNITVDKSKWLKIIR